MQTADAIDCAAQGHIFRCPECLAAGRQFGDPPPVTASCGECRAGFRLRHREQMTADLYEVMRELREPRDGPVPTRDGDSPGRGGTPSNVSLPLYLPPRLPPDMLRELHATPDGPDVLRVTASLMTGSPTVESLLVGPAGKTVPREVIREAQMMVLMKRNPGLSRDEKIAILNEHNFHAHADRADGRLYVFFGSSIAPECDSYLCWD